MITDARALQDDYIPHDLRHREGQIDALASSLKPMTHDIPGDDVFIYGPSGSGKTTLAKYVADQLEQETLAVRRAYVNCISNPSPNAVLSTLVRDAGVGPRLSSGTPKARYLDRLREADDRVLAIIDEANVLSDLDLLRALYEVAGVTIVAISISEDALFSAPDLSSQTRSRLRAFDVLRLDAYSHAEMVDILDYRVNHGLDRSRLEGDVVEYIADLATGDARDGIALLRRAARRARSDGTDITPELVEDVRADARADVRKERLRSLGTHQRALYEIVRDAQDIAAGDLHDRYQQRVQNPRGESMRRRYLESLETYGLITQTGEGRGTRYQVVETEP